MDTRIRKIQERGLDGIVLAAAGLRRLGLQEEISYSFSLEEMVPAVGQGALGMEIRTDDEATRQIVASLDHSETRTCALAERLRACILAMSIVPIGVESWHQWGGA